MELTGHFWEMTDMGVDCTSIYVNGCVVRARKQWLIVGSWLFAEICNYTGQAFTIPLLYLQVLQGVEWTLYTYFAVCLEQSFESHIIKVVVITIIFAELNEITVLCYYSRFKSQAI